jgi:hypothetical protein
MAGTRTFYRLVRHDPPTAEDFKSRCELGRRRRSERGETIADWTGLSVYDSLDAVRDLLRRAEFGSDVMGVVRVDLPEGTAIEWEKTHGAGHWTVWGSSQRIVRYVRPPVIPLAQLRR